MTVIRKVHVDKSASGMDFILSNATVDRYGDIIEVDGWQLSNFKKNPIALFNHNSSFPIGKWINVRKTDNALVGTLELAPEGTSERIDEIRKLIEAGILKAVSVGFQPIESTRMSETGGDHYLKQELVETSVVSVPANPDAVTLAKSLNVSRETQELVFGKHAVENQTVKRRGFNGENAASHIQNHKGKNMSPLSKRIEDTQTRIVSMRDQLNAHLESINDESPDDAQTAITEELTSRIAAQEKALEALKKAETSLARQTITNSSNNLPAVSGVSDQNDRGSEQIMELRSLTAGPRPFAAPAQKVKPEDYIFKAIAVAIKHYGDQKRSVLDVLKENYGDHNDHGEVIRKVMAKTITKAATIPADTVTSGWADSLIQTVVQGFIEALTPYSVYPGLAARGGKFTFGRNGVISLPGRNTASPIGGAFVAQGAPIPVKQGAFTSIQLTPKKMGVITTMTREITEHSTPAIEAILRQAMMEDTAIAIDTVLLDANAATTTRPAGLKNGITKVTASATASIVGFIADVKNLVAALIAATNGNIRAPVWIMNPGDVLAASLLQTTTGDTPFREEIAGGTLFGYPIIQSTTGLNDMMAIIDAADFMSATGDTPQFSVSDQAVLHMEDTTPAQISTVATPNTVAAPVRSLWQTDSMAIRMLLDINWAKRRTGVFQWTDTMAWN